jgi:hypothetical protein
MVVVVVVVITIPHVPVAACIQGDKGDVVPDG